MPRILRVVCSHERADGRRCGEVVGRVEDRGPIGIVVRGAYRWTPEETGSDDGWALVGRAGSWQDTSAEFVLDEPSALQVREHIDEETGDPYLTGIFSVQCRNGHQVGCELLTLRNAFDAGKRELHLSLPFRMHVSE